VSANAMRKLIPPNQRIVLENMNLKEALNFTPLAIPDKKPTLKDLLSQYPIYLQRKPPLISMGADTRTRDTILMLKDFLFVRAFAMNSAELDRTDSDSETDTGKQTEKSGDLPKDHDDIEHTIYTGLSFLKGTPRAISDLWFTLNRLTRFKEEEQQNNANGVGNDDIQAKKNEKLQKRLVNAVAQHCRDLLGEERGITPTERIRFKNSIRRNVKDNWEIGQLPLKVTCRMVRLSEFSEKDDSRQNDDNETSPTEGKVFSAIHINKAADWNIEVSSAFGYKKDQDSEIYNTMHGFRLSSGASSAIVTLHDFLALGPDGKNFISPLLNREPDFFKLAATTWQKDETSSIEFIWPQPICKSFWEYDIFKSSWNDAVVLPDGSVSLDWAVFVWLSLGTSIVDRLNPIVPISCGNALPADWTKIIKRLIKLTEPDTVNVSRRASLDWLTRVFLLIMPENGLLTSITKRFELKPSAPLRKYWRDHRQYILPRRTRRFVKMVENDLEDLAYNMMVMTPRGFKKLIPTKTEIKKKANI